MKLLTKEIRDSSARERLLSVRLMVLCILTTNGVISPRNNIIDGLDEGVEK